VNTRYGISSAKIRDVIDDLRLLGEDTRVIYTVDPHDIFEFCFPITPGTTANRSRETDPERLSDQQMALYHVFYQGDSRPLVLGEYAQELYGLHRYLQQEVTRAYPSVQLVDEMIGGAGFMQDMGGDHKRGAVQEQKEFTREHFQNFLAVIMGVYSIGVERFTDIVKHRLTVNRIHARTEGDAAVIDEAFASYRQSSLVEVILNALEDPAHREGRGAGGESSFQRANRHKANLADARAVDRILLITAELERAVQAGRLSTRHLLLYLSSARRTARVFQLPEVLDRMPLIGDGRFSIWRTIDQVYLGLVNTEAADDLEETGRLLEGMHDALLELEAGEVDRCDHCLLDGMQPRYCQRRGFCERVARFQELIRERRQTTANLALASGIEKYEKFLTARAGAANHQDLLQYFREIYASEEVRNFASEQASLMHRLLIAQSVFVSALPSVIGVPDTDENVTRDAVTSAMQHLPAKPRVGSAEYQQILPLIIDFYTAPPQSRAARLQRISDAYEQYLLLEAGTSQLSAEHELIRCLFYLTHPARIGEELAYKHALEMSTAHPELEREFRYIIVWAARRLREFQSAENQARSAIAAYPDDPRFYHGRCLNTFAWLMDDRDKQKVDSRHFARRLADAVRDAERALELYRDDPVEYRELIGVVHNNLAYLHSLAAEEGDGTGSVSHSVQCAREQLDALKAVVPKATWNPRYPEYFETEARVELMEFRASEGAPTGMRRTKLEHAERQIGTAISLLHKDSYLDLQARIRSCLDQLPADALAMEAVPG
jgi:tetratricopeptide (TPR) repeat protein